MKIRALAISVSTVTMSANACSTAWLDEFPDADDDESISGDGLTLKCIPTQRKMQFSDRVNYVICVYCAMRSN